MTVPPSAAGLGDTDKEADAAGKSLSFTFAEALPAPVTIKYASFSEMVAATVEWAFHASSSTSVKTIRVIDLALVGMVTTLAPSLASGTSSSVSVTDTGTSKGSGTTVSRVTVNTTFWPSETSAATVLILTLVLARVTTIV